MSDWKKGRGALGPLKPLIGDWATIPSADPAASPTERMACTRTFAAFGKGWVRLEAAWIMGPDETYREVALYGAGEDGVLAFQSFTNDGKQSKGQLSDGTDIHSQAVAFEAKMPAGVARVIYWPRDNGEAGFHFAVESRVKAGWNRFFMQTYGPAG